MQATIDARQQSENIIITSMKFEAEKTCDYSLILANASLLVQIMQCFCCALNWYLVVVNAIWTDYNPMDGTFEALANRTLLYHQDFIPATLQRLVRYDDELSVVMKPTYRPTHSPSNHPSNYPTPTPTNNPTKRPSKRPSPLKPTTAPTENEDEILDHLIAAKQASKRQVVKLYAAESFYLMDELEKELLAKKDSDALIVRCPLNVLNHISMQTSLLIGGYFNSIDDAFSKLQVPLRSMLSLETMFEPDEISLHNNFVQISVPIISSLPDCVFDKICRFIKETFKIIDHHQAILDYLKLLKNAKVGKSTIPSPFVGRLSEFAIIADMIFHAFLELLHSKIFDLMHVLTKSEYAKSSMFPQQLTDGWTYFSSMAKNSMDALIPKLSNHVLLCINRNVTEQQVQKYQQSMEHILFFSELVSVFKSNLEIANTLYEWKYAQKENIGTIYVAVLAHAVGGKAVVMNSLRSALGFEIERYDAKLIEHRAVTSELIKRANAGRKSNKAMFDMVVHTLPAGLPYQTLQTDMDVFLRWNISDNTTDAFMNHLMDLGAIKIYVTHPSLAKAMRIELMSKRETNTILIQDLNTLSSRDVADIHHATGQMNVIAYFEDSDATFGHLLCFLRLLNDNKLSGRELSKWIAATVWNLCKLGKRLWDGIYAVMTQNYHNESTQHDLLLEYVQISSQLAIANKSAFDKLIELETTPAFLFGDTARIMMFDVVLIALHRVIQIKADNLAHTAMNSSYSQSKQFPRDLWSQYGNYYPVELRSKFFTMRHNFTQQRLMDFFQTCYKFEIFKANFDIGRNLYDWKFTMGSAKKIDSVSLVLTQWQVTDAMVNIFDILGQLGYGQSNVQLFNAEISASKSGEAGKPPIAFRIERNWRSDTLFKEGESLQSKGTVPSNTKKKAQQKRKKRKK